MEIKVFDARSVSYAAERVFNDVFSAGTVNALGNNLTLGALTRHHRPRNAFVRDQQFSDGFSIGLGTMEFIIGEGMRGGGEVMLVTSCGTLVPIATAIDTAGTAIRTHGTLVIGKALLECSGKNKYEGKKQTAKSAVEEYKVFQ
jgi:hypothetical protein